MTTFLARWPVRLHLVLLVGISILPALGVILFAAFQRQEESVEALRFRCQTAVSDLEQVCVSTELEARRLLATLVELPQVRARDTEYCNALFRRIVAQSPHFGSLSASNPEGTLFATGVGDFGPRFVGDRLYHRRAVETKAFAAGEYVIGRNLGLKMLNFACPALDASGQIAALVQAGFSLDHIAGLARRVAVPDGARVTITDHAGTLLYTFPAAPGKIGQPDDPRLFRLMTKPEGSFSESLAGQGRWFFAYHQLRLENDPKPYLYLRLSMPESPIIAQGQAVLRRYLGVVLLAALLAMIAAWWLGRVLIVDPIQKLSVAAGRLGGSEADAAGNLPFGQGEFGVLARAFSKTSALLAERERTQKAAEASLRESEEKFARAFRDSPVGMAIRDLATGRYLEANDRCLAMTGYAREEVIGRTPVEIGWIGEAAAGTNQSLLAPAEDVRDSELQLRHKDGRTITCSYTSHAVRIAGRDCLLSITVDITERKQAEAEREKLQTQLNQAQKMESVGRLAGGVAHDFNNMLTAIQGNASLAMDELPPDSPLRENLDQILLCAQRSADLTRRLLAFARKQTVVPRVLDLNATVAGTLKMLRRLIGEDIDLVWRPAAGLRAVKVDPGQVDQVLANLCVNARDAINGVGRLVLATANATFDEAYCSTHGGSVPGDYVMFSVSDNGCGMNQEVLAHLFEPFFTTKDVGQGTGLGLATVFGIVKQNAGYIEVESAPGQGTTFKIYLPAHAGHVDPTDDEGIPLSVDGGHETILLVEDEPAILRMSERALQALGYTVLAAGGPGAAIQRAAEHRGEIHLLMTDVVMPEMNGQELARQLLSRHPNLRLLFMSGYTANVIAPHGMLEDGTHFLPKPFSTGILARKVREALDEKLPGR